MVVLGSPPLIGAEVSSAVGCLGPGAAAVIAGSRGGFLDAGALAGTISWVLGPPL